MMNFRQEILESFIRSNGTKILLEDMIAIYSKHQVEYLARLVEDLTTALNNYENRYDSYEEW